METLDISSFVKEACNAFPISGSILINELFKFFVFILRPPSFFKILIFLAIFLIDLFHFGDDVIDKILTLTLIIRSLVAVFFAAFFFKVLKRAIENLFG